MRLVDHPAIEPWAPALDEARGREVRDLKKRACQSHLSSRIARGYFFPPSFNSSSLAKGESVAGVSPFFSVVA